MFEQPMNKLISLLFAPLIFLSACAQNSGNKSFTNVNATEFQKLISSGKGILLDVRTINEFKNGHIANAGQLDIYAPDFGSKLLLLPKDQPIYIYCLTGSRSKSAAQFLIQNGYANVYNLQRGIMEWNQQNLPVVTDASARPDTENAVDTGTFAEMLKSSDLVFVDFYAPWCSPCIKMMPMIDKMKVEYKDKINIVKVNVDASKMLVKELKLTSVPHLVLYHKGEIVYSKSSAVTEEELTSVFKDNLLKYSVSAK